MHDFDQDEFRRAVRAADRAHDDAMPGFREALKRLFSPDSRHRSELAQHQKAALLGVPVTPARRNFLQAGGLAAVGAVAFAACGDDDPGSATAGGSTMPGSGSPTAGDAELATAAVQLENTAVLAYTKVAEIKGAELPQAVVDAATLFIAHHTAHAAALNAVLTGAGAEAIPSDQYFQPAVDGLPDDDAIAAADLATLGGVARDLEQAAAATYITAVPQLSLPSLRQALMGIGGAEACHVLAWNVLLQGDDVLAGYGATAPLVVGGNYSVEGSFL